MKNMQINKYIAAIKAANFIKNVVYVFVVGMGIINALKMYKAVVK